MQCTGQSNAIILENLRYLDDCGAKLEIRIPFVPEKNDDQVGKIAEFLATKKHVALVRVLPYHNYAGSKYASLDMCNTLPEALPTDEALEKARNCIRKHGLAVE